MKDFKMTAESLKKQLTELNKIRKDAGLAELTDEAWKQSLNPYCSGRWSRTTGARTVVMNTADGLNPCCSGRWSRTALDGRK